MKFNRRDPCFLPDKVGQPKAWFYVNEGSISVLIASRDNHGAVEATISRKYLVAALAAMRQR